MIPNMVPRAFLFMAAIAGWMVSGSQVWAAERRTFSTPTINNVRLDWCKHWARECGQPAADLFCTRQGFDKAASIDREANVGARGVKTLVYGDGRICAQPTCSAFRAITCVKAATTEPSVQTTQPSALTAKPVKPLPSAKPPTVVLVPKPDVQQLAPARPKETPSSTPSQPVVVPPTVTTGPIKLTGLESAAATPAQPVVVPPAVTTGPLKLTGLESAVATPAQPVVVPPTVTTGPLKLTGAEQ